MPTISVPLRDPVGGILILLTGTNGAYEGTLPLTNLDYIMDTIQRFPYQSLYQIDALRRALRRSMQAHRRHMNMEVYGELTVQAHHINQIGPSARQYYMHRDALRHPIFYLD